MSGPVAAREQVRPPASLTGENHALLDMARVRGNADVRYSQEGVCFHGFDLEAVAFLQPHSRNYTFQRQLTAILTNDAHRVRALLGKPSVIYDPRDDGALLLQRWQRLATHTSQQRMVTPGSIHHQMVERLMHAAHVVRSQTGRHGLDALAFSRQQQAGAVVLQRGVPIGMSRGLSQAFEIGRKTFLLGAWRGGACSHRTSLLQNVLFITQ